MDSSLSHRVREGLNACYWRQIFALDYVVKTQNCLARMEAPGPDGLNARVLNEWSTQISPILKIIYRGSYMSAPLVADIGDHT